MNIVEINCPTDVILSYFYNMAEGVGETTVSDLEKLFNQGMTGLATAHLEVQAEQSKAAPVMAGFIDNADGSGGATNTTIRDLIPENPIGMLQEMCMSRHWLPPLYKTVNTQGMPNERLFTIACVVTNHRETGTGKSKKLAKTWAAHKMLNRLQNMGEAIGEPAVSKRKNFSKVAPKHEDHVAVGNVMGLATAHLEVQAEQSKAAPVMAGFIDNADGSGGATNTTIRDLIPENPIGMLQEMCVSRHWLPPLYKMVNTQGMPNERLFTIACVVFNHRETGTGKSKKLAKTWAAHRMLERLCRSPISSSGILPVFDEANNDEGSTLDSDRII